MGSKQDDHNRGQKDGANATWFDVLVEEHNLFTSPEYRAGYRHGYANRPQKDWFEWPKDDKPKEEKVEEPEPARTQVESSSGYNDSYYDDYSYYEPAPPPAPTPPPKIIYETVRYEASGSGYSKIVSKLEFDTEKEKQKFLERERRIEYEIFKDDPDWERKAIERGEQERIRKDYEALKSVANLAVSSKGARKVTSRLEP